MTTPGTTNLHMNVAVAPEHTALMQAARGTLSVAESFDIDGPEMALMASSELKHIAETRSKLVAAQKYLLEPVAEMEKRVKSLIQPCIATLDSSDKVIRSKLDAYIAKEQERVALENKAREDEDRKRRQKAEEEAAASRARAEAQAAELRKQAERAQEQARAAAEAGNAKAAAAEAAKAAAALERAENVAQNGERVASEKELSTAATVAAKPDAAGKIAGYSIAKSWTAQLAPDKSEEDAVRAIVHAIATTDDNPRTDALLALLKIDWTSAKKLAKALEKHFQVPGLVAVQESKGKRTRSKGAE